MSGIAIRVTGITVDTASTVSINYEVIPAGAGVAFKADVTVPFSAPEAGINGSLVASAKAISAGHGFHVGAGDPVLLFSGTSLILQVASPPPALFAHVVMKGSTVDSVFIGAGSDEGPAEAAAQARASGIAVASEGDPQEDALRQAPWIARAPANPS